MIKRAVQRNKAPTWYRNFHISDYVTLLHLPFSSVVMGFVTIGATMAKTVYVDRLILTLIGVFFAHQSAHYLDEIKGHHWGTKIPDTNLYAIGFLFLGIGVVIGIYLALTVSLWVLLFIPPLIFVPIAYNLELWHGKFHSPIWFGIGGGALVYLGSYFLQSLSITLFSILMSIAIGIQSTYIIILYEGTKVEKTRALAWNALKGIVVIWCLVALSMLAMRFTNW
jgi:hypothetical protein